MKRAFLLLAILAVGGAIVFSGYKIFGKKTTKPNSGTSSQPASNKPSASDPSEGGKYLVIKEWGVRLPISELSTQGIKYVFNTDLVQDFGGQEAVDFYTPSFNQSALKCDEVGSQPKVLARLVRESTTGSAVTTDPAPIKELKGFRYYSIATDCKQAVEQKGSSEDQALLTKLTRSIDDIASY